MGQPYAIQQDVLGTKLKQAYRRATGRRTMTCWLVDKNRQPITSDVRVEIGGAPDEFLSRWPQAFVPDHHIHVQRKRSVGDEKAPGYEPVTESP